MRPSIAARALLHVLWLALLAMPAAPALADSGDDCLQWVQNGTQGNGTQGNGIQGTGFTCVLTRAQSRRQTAAAAVGSYMKWDKAIWQDEKKTCTGNRDPYFAAICAESEGIRRNCAARTPFDFTPAQRAVCHMTGEWNGSASRSMALAAYLVDHQESALACANIIQFERVNIFESLDKRAARLDARSAPALRKRLQEIGQRRHEANVGVIKESLKSLKPAGSELLASYLESDQSWSGRFKEFVENISGAGQGRYANCLSRHADDLSFCNSLQTGEKIARIQGDAAIVQGAADAVLGSFMQCSKLTADVVNFLQADAAFPVDQAEKPVIFEGAVDKAKERLKEANKQQRRP
jgi:hypothetical protein